jgi:hypothetical protein
MYARVQEMMHKAFWDLLASELSEDPPSYNQAMTLLREIKEVIKLLTSISFKKIDNYTMKTSSVT